MEAEVNTTVSVLVSGGNVGEGGQETKAATAAGELTRSPRGNVDRKASTRPPVDDCCPICFGEFSVACKANCGHWYCGSCILQLWNFSAVARPCKCPMCSSNITNLTPDASFFNQQDREVREVLLSVEKYNRLYVGGVRGLVQKVFESPLLIKRLFTSMMDPDRHVLLVCNDIQFLSLAFTLIYSFSPYKFIPLSHQGVYELFTFGSLVIVFTLQFIGIFRRRRLRQQIWQMAAEPLPE